MRTRYQRKYSRRRSWQALSGRPLRLLLLMAVTVGASFAAEPKSDWAALNTLAPGDQIKIYRYSEKTLRGRFVSHSADEVTLETKSGGMSVQRDEVWRVSRRGKRKLLLGALIGAGAGALAMITWIIRDEYEDDVVYPIAGTLLGAGVGALFRGYTDVYRVSKGRKRVHVRHRQNSPRRA